MPILGAEAVLQLRQVAHDPVEDAAVFAHLRQPVGGAAAIAEQALEDDARVGLHRIRIGRGAPRDAVGVDAAVAVVAIADEIRLLHRHLERSQRRVLAEHLRRQLVGGRPVADVSAFGVLGMNAAQPDRASTRVLAVAVPERFRLFLAQTDRHDHLVAKRRQR